MHLSPDFGLTATEIEYPIDEKFESLMSSDSPEGIAKSMGITTLCFAQTLAHNPPDILLVTGDRYEMFAAAAAAVPFRIPLAHLDGGALTFGAFDEAWRHSMTKMAHLHFCYTDENAARVRQMGEEAWRVATTGSPALDDIPMLGLWKNFRELGISATPDTLLVVFHSTTMEWERAGEYTDNLLAALLRVNHPVIFVMPNADTGGRIITKKMRHFAAKYPKWAQAHANLWPDVFRALMCHCGAMVGNSSAGIMEAPSFKLPVVNIGTRQDGRARARNVIDVDYSVNGIVAGIEWATQMSRTHELDDLTNPYGDGNAAMRIVAALKSTPIDEKLLIKRWAA
jgi:UDP-hydrolysing UDP-N-acetyl-D-glucosamine 2-epimerase